MSDACGPSLTPVFSGSGPKEGPRIVMYDRLVSLLSSALSPLCPALEISFFIVGPIPVNIYRIFPPPTENGNLYTEQLNLLKILSSFPFLETVIY